MLNLLKFRSVFISTCLLLFSFPISAQSDDDDLLDDLGGPDSTSSAPSSAGDDEDIDNPEIEQSDKALEEEVEVGDDDRTASTKSTTQKDYSALDKVKAVPRKPVLKTGRFELGAFFATSLNDAYWQHMSVSGSAIYYIHDAFGLGIGLDYLYAHIRNSNVEVIRRSLTSVPSVFEHPRLFAHADLYFVPIYGKVSLFDAFILHFDIYASTGMGFATAFGERRPLAINAAVGQRFFLSDWLAIRAEVRDHLFLDNQEVFLQKRSDVQNYLMFMAGASFFIPPTFEYSYR